MNAPTTTAATLTPTLTPTHPARVLDDVAQMIVRILGTCDLEDLGIGMETSFHDDLEMESIDLVTLAGMLTGEYGADVNLAEFLADKDLDEVIDLTIGDIVDFVVSRTGR
ncbi:MAG: acyl carrier protein [Actinomycetota bacterium]|nr:acyl carrier protein [Actinomycetota bacterium]